MRTRLLPISLIGNQERNCPLIIEPHVWSESGEGTRKSTSILSDIPLCLLLGFFFTLVGCAVRPSQKASLERGSLTGSIFPEFKDSAGYRERAVKSLKDGNLSWAIADYQKALELDPTNARLYVELASLYEKQKDYQKMIEVCARGMEKVPDDSKLRLQLGNAYSDADFIPQAIASYQQAVALNPHETDAYYNLGLAYDKSYNYAGAIAAYQKVLEYKPHESAVHCNLAAIYLNKGKDDKAQEHCLKAIEDDPGDADAYYNLGLVYYRGRRYTQAAEMYRKAVQLKPTMDEAYFNLALALERNLEFQESVKAWQDYLKITEDDSRVNTAVAHIISITREHHLTGH